MFTGLVETVGAVSGVSARGAGARLGVRVVWPHGDRQAAGDSVAVNGACLTVLEPSEGGFAADLSPETLRRTVLGSLAPGAPVNLERALRLGDRLGGHLVQGHVDAVVRVLSVRSSGAFATVRVELPAALEREVAVKGSVALDGVSLTVSETGPGWFEVAVIPETLRVTTLGGWRGGERVHLETDVLAKYVGRQLQGGGSAIDVMFGGGDA